MKRSILQKLVDSSDLPGENLPGQPLVELIGDERVLIEHHKGIIEYGKEQIQIRVKYGSIRVCGHDLRLCRMHGPQLVIMGKIDSICVQRGK